MRELDVRLLEGQNSAAVDVFPIRHAEKVLAAFGRAFGTLPDDMGQTSNEQREFVKQSVAGLAEDGKVVCIRLALFAEMMKGKVWSPATLNEVGGTTGVGVTFLEETFSASTALPEHRYHQKAARAILKSLLPDSGSDIKGTMRSHAELWEASRAGHCPGDFDDLIRILDSETRLITPTDPAGKEAGDDSAPQKQTGQKYYQLTHDYLVHSLREWLTRKQRETRRGRAELRLSEQAAFYQRQPVSRHLPSFWEFLNVRLLTSRKIWTGPQQEMMHRASRFYGLRGALAVVACVLCVAAGLFMSNTVAERQNALQAEWLVEGLLAADIVQVPDLVDKLADSRAWVDPLLGRYVTSQDDGVRLRASLALLPVDPGQADYLRTRLLRADPDEVPVLCQMLAPHKNRVTAALWQVLRTTEPSNDEQRLRAACGLAAFEPDNSAWQDVSVDVAGLLAAANPTYSRIWMEALRPVRELLFQPLFAIFADSNRREIERVLVTELLVQYTADNPIHLAEFCLAAEPQQFLDLFPLLERHGARGIERLETELGKTLDPGRGGEPIEREKESLTLRQANAAVALARLGRTEKIWPLLRYQPDPCVQGWIIHRLAAIGADPQQLIDRLDREQDVSVRRALLLALGEFDQQSLPASIRERLAAKLLDWYRDDPDAGIHAAVEWLVRHWDEGPTSNRKPDRRIPRSSRSQSDLLLQLHSISTKLATGKIEGDRRWYVNRDGQTLVVLHPQDVPFLMGSPDVESKRSSDEALHEVVLPRRFAIANKEVTVEQYRKQFPEFDHFELRRSPEPSCPVQGVTWYEAAEYCNRLSAAEGIPKDQWCYLPNAQDKFAAGMRLAPDYLCLTGYRLPTEAEWEYACRAGAVTSRYYGESDQLLGQYAWYLANSQDRNWPGGLKKPNAWGLFDMLGNVYEWCNDEYAPYGTGINEDRESAQAINDQQIRVLRGGSWNFTSPDLRAAYRNRARPIDRYYLLGFRLARTFASP